MRTKQNELLVQRQRECILALLRDILSDRSVEAISGEVRHAVADGGMAGSVKARRKARNDRRTGHV